MDRILIKGGQALVGNVPISGAKNAALPILASTLLGSDECIITNIPRVRDVKTMGDVLAKLGATVHQGRDEIVIKAATPTSTEAPYDLVKTMRASILVLGPLLARFGEATVSLPGGCAIGARPVDLHLRGLEELGAEVQIEHGYIHARAPRLKGARIHLDVPTVTGTENLLMAASLAEGTTVIDNAAMEPEIVDLGIFLTNRGARIHGVGTPTITIEGVPCLDGGTHRVVADRIEAGTYLVAGAITGGDVQVEGCVPEHLLAVTAKLREAGAQIAEEKSALRLHVTRPLNGVTIKTLVYPGFCTDMQAQMMALMCRARGRSVISETVFESRFLHVPELQRMGADITIQGSHAVVNGSATLTGAPVMASDLRASAGLVLAGLAAEGETEVSRVYHLDRGYERLEEKLSALGATIQRLPG